MLKVALSIITSNTLIQYNNTDNMIMVLYNIPSIILNIQYICHCYDQQFKSPRSSIGIVLPYNCKQVASRRESKLSYVVRRRIK